MKTTLHTHPEPYIYHPIGKHTNTLILLHGTSSTGPELASDLLSFTFNYPHLTLSTSVPDPTISSSYTLAILTSLLPTTRFVFPTGSLKPTTVFHGALMHAWFDIHTFADRTVGEEDQVVGMRESATYLVQVIEEERKLLGCDEQEAKDEDGDLHANKFRCQEEEEGISKVAVLGFSQGCAMGIIMLLAGLLDGHAPGIAIRTTVSGERRASGRQTIPFIGLSGWLPFRAQFDNILTPISKIDSRSYIRSLLQIPSLCTSRPTGKQPIHLSHGALDTKVTLECAVQMVSTLRNLEGVEKGKGEHNCVRQELELTIEANVYDGLGHWFNGEELCGVVDFLKRVWEL